MAERQSPLLALGDALQAAAAEADWDRLAALTGALAPALHALAARGPWSAAERAALQALRQQHDGAAAAVAAAKAALGARLDELHANRDGWLAYAMHAALHSESQE